ncbi:lasso peptide isopeptide bond-forming cyclase [Promicromonospora sukumoe]|uniref:asparagine synthase (glutamine-hydrolyzing) n=1 Tax=Promicromonospora sukumoe TaxID=88382 RepID=A0A7W3JCH6_9MICO|nr:albusnodin/ikarugamycin family macrolactam cyclase [Promicromonospora sukumoe]MBA8810318.1 asparagine synthase (glutamine-hydrolyzing) [Promicromonospora sukumoe]
MVWLAGASAAIPGPGQARQLWGGERPVWVVDEPDRPETVVRMVEDGTQRLAVVGDVWLSGGELARGLAHVRRSDWHELTRWPGSYWVVADTGRSTVVLTDLCGQRPVYHARSDDVALWATQAKPLAHATKAAIDQAGMVHRLVVPTLGDLVGAHTTFAGVHRVPGGHALTLTARSRHVDPYEPDQQPTTFAESAVRLRDALTTAIEARTTSPAETITADFSGGLDSTTLALLTARAGRDVLGVTLADRLNPNDDVSYAVLAATAEPRLRHELVAPEPPPTFFNDLLEAPITDQPHSDAGRWARKWSYQRHAVAAGSTLHLTGSGGDLLLAAPATCLADLAASGHHLTLWRAARARARLRHRPVYDVAQNAYQLADTSYPDALRQLAAAIRLGGQRAHGRRPLRWLVPSGVAAWLTPNARIGLLTSISDLATVAPRGYGSMSRRRARDEVREFGTYQAELNAQAASLGLRLHTPFLDNEVVRACVALPPYLHNHPHRQKPLMAEALRGLVPSSLLDRRTKGVYGAAGYVGVARNIEVIRCLLDSSELVATGLLDADAVAHDLALAAAGIPTRFAALESVITAELWLSQYRAETSVPQWEVTAHAH